MKYELNKVYNTDCLEAMKQIPDKWADLAIVDPPYGIGYDVEIAKANGTKYGSAKAKKRTYNSKGWDSCIPSQEYFKELFRISSNQIIWGGNYFTEHLIPTKGWVVWDKNMNGQFGDGELAWTSFEKPLKIYEFTWNGMLQGNMKEKEERMHPTQKPVQLYKWLLKNYAKPGDKILDTHLGSGSSRIAAFDMGFDFLGFELDPEYFQKAEERFKQHIRQQVLFPPQRATPKLFEAA